MRIEFLNPTSELIGLLASIEEFLIGEIVVTDAIHVEAVTPRAINMIQLLKDPVFTKAPAGTNVSTADHSAQFNIAVKSAFDAATGADDR
jgi:hypothetical protein